MCMGSGECVHCEGKGYTVTIVPEGLFYDEEHGWIIDPDDGVHKEKKVTKKCDLCHNGICGYCSKGSTVKGS